MFLSESKVHIDRPEILVQEHLQGPGKTEHRITIVSRSVFHREICAVKYFISRFREAPG